MTAGVDLRYTYSKWWSFARHNWHGEWNPHPDPGQKHVGVMNLLHGVQIMNWRFPILDLKVCAQQVGIGIIYVKVWEISIPPHFSRLQFAQNLGKRFLANITKMQRFDFGWGFALTPQLSSRPCNYIWRKRRESGGERERERRNPLFGLK